MREKSFSSLDSYRKGTIVLSGITIRYRLFYPGFLYKKVENNEMTCKQRQNGKIS